MVHLYNAVPDGSGVEGKVTIQQHLLWDRKVEGGFPGVYCFLVFNLSSLPKSIWEAQYHFANT